MRSRTRNTFGSTTVALTTVALLLSGCASQQAATTHGDTPPKLQIAGSQAGAASEAAVGAAAVAPMLGAPDGQVSGGFALFGGYVLAGPLPAGPTHAPVWRWMARPATQDDVRRVGEAAGVTGTPQHHPHGWLLSSAAGEIRVSDAAGNPWSYTRADLLACSPYVIDIDNLPDGTASGCGIATSSDDPLPKGPDDAATRAAAASLVTGLGLAGSEQVSVGAPASLLTISPAVGGLATQGIETSIDVDANGVRGAYGRLTDPLVGDDYPLRTPAQAFADLGNGPHPMMALRCGPVGVMTPDTVEPQPLPACPTPVPVRVTGASIGLQLSYDGTGAGSDLLVPSWFFTIEGSTTPTAIIAIDPSFIEQPARPSGPATGDPAEPPTPISVPPAMPADTPPAMPADTPPATKPTM